ncbi:MAG: OmpA family protein [Bacteroidetes bacterium]|nr:OmpA family protein [Bacteroidota bacterium]
MFRVFIVCSIFLCNSFYSKALAVNADTLRLYYNINVKSLSNLQLTQLDSFLLCHHSQEILNIKIIAYADFLANAEYNKTLSQHRADNVKQYLFTNDISSKIIQCIGMGELPPELYKQPQGIKENRRVEIILNYNTRDIRKHNSAEKTTTVEISKAKNGEHIIMKNFNFLPARHYLTAVSQPELEVLLNTLVENPNLEIEIQGHICCEYKGNDGFDKDTYTNNLSVNRAKYIYDYLIKNGISSDRLQYKGLGSSKPLIYPENSIDDEDKNRRVEIVIVKK